MTLDTEVLANANMTQTQLLMWTGQMLSGRQPIFNMGMAIGIDAPLDHATLKQSFDYVVRKSDNLRSVFHHIEGGPQRRVLPFEDMTYELPLLDFTQNPDEADAWMQGRMKVRIDLKKRLFRSALLKVGDDRYIWFICKHHLICDGWSFSNFVSAVGDRYAQLESGNTQESELPQFDEFVDREVNYYLSDECARSSEYWAEETREPLPPLKMYGLGPEHGSMKFGRVHRRLGAEFIADMKSSIARKQFRAFSEDQGMFLLMITALVAQLKRASGNDRFAIGVCLHHRLTPQDKATIGPFFVFSAIRVTVRPDDTFRELYSRVAKAYRRMLRHYRHPVSAPPGDRVWDVTVNFVNKTFPDFAGRPTRVTWLQSGAYLAQEFVGLQIQHFNREDGMTAEWDFNQGIFGTERRREMAMQDFENAVSFGLENPDAPLSAYIEDDYATPASPPCSCRCAKSPTVS